jgi:predicted MFS family arabinose efflux permease
MYASIAGAIEGISTVSAPTIGGIVVESLSWRWCFALPGLLGAFTFVVMALLFKDIQTPERSSWKQRLRELDLIGNLIFLPSLTCLFTALSWAGTKYPWDSGVIIALFCVFAFLLILFAIEQYLKGDTATLPPQVLKNRNVLSGFAYSICCNSTANVVEYYLPTYFQAIRGYTPTKSGLLMLPTVFGMLLSMLMQGFGVRAFGYYVPFMLAGSVLMPVFSGLMTTLTITTPLSTVIVYSGFFGAAIGIGFQAPQVAVQNSLTVNDVNTGLAIILFAQNFGPAINVALAQSIFQNKLADNIGDIVPNLSKSKIQNMGLGDLRRQIGPQKLQELLNGFDKSLMQTWYLAVGLACATLVGSTTMQWRSVKKKRT